MSIAGNVHRVRERIADAARKSGRNPDDVTLVAVTKTRTIDEIKAVVDAGILFLGENRVQEAAAKIPAIENTDVVWRLIGHLQSNKAKQAVPLFPWIDSVDSRKLIDILDRRAAEEEKNLNILVQVNISSELSKSGVTPAEAESLLRYASGRENLTVNGLLAIGSFGATETVTREEFKRMKGLFDRLKDDPEIGETMQVLSMGMSGDYAIAVEEGASMVRVGTSIFGQRA